MHSSGLALLELGGIFFVLGLLGHTARRLGISPIPFYLVGGLMFGQGGLLDLGHADAFAEIAAEIGVVLLLLLLGLEYSADELVTGLRRSWSAGVVDAVLNATPGALIALMLGWGWVAALAMAGVTWISSSGVVAKTLSDLGRLGNRETPVVLSILVLEDLAMAVYLPVLTALLIGVGWVGGISAVTLSVFAIAMVLLVALRYGRFISMVVDSSDPEAFLLRLLGAALLMAGLAAELDISAAVGAFLLGIAISGSTAVNAVRILAPLRDLFAAMFFVVFGLNTDPGAIPPVLGVALVLVVVTTATKILTGWWAAQRAGIAAMGRLRAGTALVARGEFSIVIAGLAVGSGAVDADLGPLAATYVLLMAILGPTAARFVEPVARATVLRVTSTKPAQGAS